MVSDDVKATTLVSLDDDVIATAPEISEANIVEKITNGQENEDRMTMMTRFQSNKYFILLLKGLHGQKLNLL